VSGPTRWAGRHALADTAWQERMQARLSAAGARLAALLGRHGLAPEGGTPLFQWLRHPEAAAIAEALARRAILVRHFPDHHGLRFGLPGDEPGWQRLDAALDGILSKGNGQD
jgi:cobalamin biosynthetic protein CobC